MQDKQEKTVLASKTNYALTVYAVTTSGQQ